MTPLPQDAEVSLADQVALTTGADFWTTRAVGPVPSMLLVDGPHGVRKQAGSTDHLGLASSIPATCFPPAVALAQTWDPALARRVGEALGDEAAAAGVSVLLGPGINIKRDPRCGRNFEYFSEDPLLTGELGVGWVQGLQSRGVGASLKHFAANNAETDRMRVSADVDARTLREVYLRAFERVVTRAQPWTVMCSYNRINGVYAAENEWLLSTVLRGEWGFDGVVVSDWGAVRDRVAAVRAGLDLEMPGTGARTDATVLAAARADDAVRTAVVRAADRVARLAARAADADRPAGPPDLDAHHALAREVAGRAVVLLQNEGDLLPLAPSTPLAVVGEFARTPRYQGGGSSRVNATRVDVPLEEIRALAGDAPVTFAPGFTLDGSGDPAALRTEAVEAAAAAGTAVVFLGLTEDDESEGFDRTHLDIPAEQFDLLRAVVATQPRTVVVLAHGGVVRLTDVAATAPAVLDAALLGQAGGGAIADVLFGAVNPSGRLAETVPLRLEDVPAFPGYPGEHGHDSYGERVFVGHRWYDARGLEVAFPFGHGLSYTAFEYADLELTSSDAAVSVRLTVTNTGSRSGREVVQVYAGLPASEVARPPRSLVAFTGVTLDAGESRRIEVLVERGDLAVWEVRADRWGVEGGEYVLAVGASSRDLRLTGSVPVTGDAVDAPFTRESTVGDLLADRAAGPLVRQLFAGFLPSAPEDGGSGRSTNLERMVASLPLDRLPTFARGAIDDAQLDQLLEYANGLRAAGDRP